MGSVASSAVANRERLLSSVDKLPPFSPILDRLIARLAREDVLFADISDLIEKDTVLAGNLLRIVNSALYGLTGTVNSVRHALSIIGLEKVRNIVLALSVSRLWSRQPAVEGWSSARFSLHSTAVAIFSDLLAQHLPADYPEGAFTAGLLHDFGKLLLATALPLEFDSIRSQVELGNAGLVECEAELVGITHPELAAAALARWNLPAPIAQAVEFHHAPEAGEQARVALSKVVHAADRCANRLDITVLGSHPERGQPPEEILATLGLARKAPDLLREFEMEFELVKPFF